MAMDQSALLELLDALQAADVDDRVRLATQNLYQALIDAEAHTVIGAGPWERSEDRVAVRNGTRPRVLSTTAGDLELRIPKLHTGSFFPSLLERRRRIDQALFAVVMEARLHGVSTRKVDDLLQSPGLTGIDKSQVSRVCKTLDEVVEQFRGRPLEGTYPYLWLDAVHMKVRHNHRIVNEAVVLAIGARDTGEREILGLSVGMSEEEASWQEFLRALVRRGLKGGPTGDQ